MNRVITLVSGIRHFILLVVFEKVEGASGWQRLQFNHDFGCRVLLVILWFSVPLCRKSLLHLLQSLDQLLCQVVL